MSFNPFSRTGRQARPLPVGAGRSFFLVSSSSANITDLQQLYTPNEAGVPLVYTSWTSVLAACVAGKGDTIVIDPSFTTAPTAAELLSAETKGVVIYPSTVLPDGSFVVTRATAALPQTTSAAIFTVTGRVRLLDIIGEVTTVIQTQANNTKLLLDPTVGADVDLCAVNDISADAVGTNYHITGTFADAMVATTSGAGVAQAAPTILTAGAIELSCAASNTGSVKWLVRYIPLDPGAVIVAA